MHNPPDDSLERDLARLSTYTGSPTQVWRDAIHEHRQERQRQLWIWVRRPIPAVAAAALCVMVAALALRDFATVPERADLRHATLRAPTADPGIDVMDRGGGASNVEPARLHRPTLTPEIEKSSGTALSEMSDGTPASATSVITQNARNSNTSFVRHNRDLSNATGEQFPVPTSSSPSTSENSLSNGPAAGSGIQPPQADLNNEMPPPAQTANVWVYVPDVTDFYNNDLPRLVDNNLGEQVVRLDAVSDKQSPLVQGELYNFQLLVTENRLPIVMQELQQRTQVQSVASNIADKDVRLAQIDSLLRMNDKLEASRSNKDTAGLASKHDARRSETQPKSPPASQSPANQWSADELRLRRARIADGSEFARITIVAIPPLAQSSPAQVNTQPGSVPASDIHPAGSSTLQLGAPGQGPIQPAETATSRQSIPSVVWVLSSALILAMAVWLVLRRSGTEPPPTPPLL